MNYTPDQITELKPHQILVFGSNKQGRHGKGVAKLAMQFGAIYGKPTGRQGQTYAIVTKDLTKGVRSIPLEQIQEQLIVMLRCARLNPHLEFLVTKLGTGLAGYTDQEIGRLFADLAITGNVRLPHEFWKEVAEGVNR